MPRLTPTQQSAAAERKQLTEKAEDAKRRRYIEVAAMTGAPAQLVAEVVEAYHAQFGSPSVAAPEPKAKPVKPTPTMVDARIGTIYSHLIAIRALFRLLPPETAEEAREALKTTEEALVAWDEVREGRTDKGETP